MHLTIRVIQVHCSSWSYLDETKVRKYVWTRFRKGEVLTNLPQRVAGMWHRRGRLKAIGWACRFFVGMMGHTSRQRYHNAHILYTRMHGASHRLAELLKRMLQDYFAIEVLIILIFSSYDGAIVSLTGWAKYLGKSWENIRNNPFILNTSMNILQKAWKRARKVHLQYLVFRTLVVKNK